MKTKMKKNAKAFLAILFSAVLVFEAWGATSVVSNKATSTQSVVNTTTEDGTDANSDMSVSSNYYVEPLTNTNALAVASDTPAVLAASTEDGAIGTAMPETIEETSTETDYYIETLDQFNSFQAESQSNTFAGLTIHLAADIELSEDFAGIGSTDYPFAGTFDGHGYSITKLSSTTNGLFVAVEGATIQNLAIGNAKVALAAAASNVGILAGTANGATVDNVVIASSKITSDAVETSAIGGMFGKVSGAVTISNSDVKRLTIKTAGMTSAMGGFVGQADAAVTMSGSDIANSYVRSTFASTTEYVSYFGGIVGYATAAVNATDVDAAAMNIQIASLVKGVGTIAGYLTGDASSFEDCDVTVTKIVTTAMNDTAGNEHNHLGGFVGCVDSDSTFVDCHVSNGTIKPQGRTNNLAGFIGSTRSEAILEKPVSGKVTIDACTVTNVMAKTASNRACGKIGGLVGLVGEGVSITNCIVDGFTGPQNKNSSDVAGLVGNVYATDGSKTVVASNIINNINVSGKNYLGTVIGRSTATNGTLEELYYTNVTLNQQSVGNVYECAGAKTPTAEELASAEMAWKLNTINGTVENTLTWAQGENGPVYASEDAKATVRVSFVQPSGTVYRYTDATGNVVLPSEVDENYAWPEGTYFEMDTVVNAAMAGNIGTEFPVPMNSAPTATEYSIKTKEQLESFQDASMEYDFTGITIHMLSDIDWGGEEGGDWMGIGKDETLPFTGTFDGHGYAIRNLYSETSGLFYIAGSTEAPVTIKNLTLEAANINSSEDNMAIVVSTILGNPQRVDAGGSASNNPNQITNVQVVDSVANFSGNNCGIIIGGNFQEDDAAKVTGCTVSGTTLNCVSASSASNYGMVIGYDGSQGYSRFQNNTIENSVITAENCTMSAVGMVAGRITGRGQITGCTVDNCEIDLSYATTSVAQKTSQIGGLAGLLNTSQTYCANNTVNNMTITTASFSTSLGLGIGQVNGGLVQNVNVTGGSITTTYNATADQAGRFGGVVGAFGNVAAKLYDCTSTGVTITSASRANSIGGLIGGIESKAVNSLVNGCTSTNFTANMAYASAKAHAYHMGGAIGRVMAKSHITDTTVNNAAINTDCLVMCVGGFVGYVSGDYPSVVSDCSVKTANIIQEASADSTSKKNYHLAGFAGCVDSGAKFTGCSVDTVRIRPQRYTNNHAGLIGSTESLQLGEVKNAPITVKSCSVYNVNMDPKNNNNHNEVGGLIGRLTEGSTVEDCYVSTITASRNGNNQYIGGLVGWIVAGDITLTTTIKNCYVEGMNAKAKNNNLAGYIVGVNDATNGSFSNLYNYNVSFTGPTAYTSAVQGSTASADNVTNGSIVTALNVDNNKAWTQGTSSPVLGTFKGTTELKMLNYNIFYEIVNDTYYINNRRQKVMEMIQTCVDDMGVNVIALQEVTAKVWYNHMTSFVNSNSNWAWTGYGRYGATMGTWNGTSNDAFNLILYNTDVYSKVNEGHFWLSNTPDQESYDTDLCYNKRCVNWVELKDKTTGKSFVVVDQHLEETRNDYAQNDAGHTLTPEDGPAARINQANLICDRMANYVANGTPVILAGDFNSSPGQGDAYETIIGRGYQCTRDYAQVADTHGAYTAFNRTDTSLFAKGDHIFTSANCTATLYDVLSDEDIDDETGYHISDHCPIIANIQY